MSSSSTSIVGLPGKSVRSQGLSNTGATLIAIPSSAPTLRSMSNVCVDPGHPPKCKISIFRERPPRLVTTVLDDVVSLDILEVIPEYRLTQAQHLQDPVVGYRVVGVAALTPHLDITAPGQAS